MWSFSKNFKIEKKNLWGNLFFGALKSVSTGEANTQQASKIESVATIVNG